MRDFPALYRERHGDTRETRMCDGFPGDGWEPLIRRMSEKLEPFCVGTELRAVQVKEKWGTLRVYMRPRDALPGEGGAAIRAAEGESGRVCAGCGVVGRLWQLGRALCADCTALRQQETLRRREARRVARQTR